MSNFEFDNLSQVTTRKVYECDSSMYVDSSSRQLDIIDDPIGVGNPCQRFVNCFQLLTTGQEVAEGEFINARVS